MGAASVTSIELVLSRTCWSADAGSNGTGQGADELTVRQYPNTSILRPTIISYGKLFSNVFNKTCDQQ